MAGISKNPSLVSVLPLFIFFCFIVSCDASNTITRDHQIRDGESLVSQDDRFELGFFGQENSTSRYLGIWYKNIEPRTVIWVANREKPVSGNNGVLRIAEDGNLVLQSGGNGTVWSSRARIESNRTIAVLYGTGNLVLSDSDTTKSYWQSFDHPADTYLPGMRVRVNPSMGENRAFVSWNSENDPSPGKYSLGVDPNGAPQIVIWEGQTRKWRSGQWNSQIFTGVPDMSSVTNYLYGFKLSSPPDSNGSVYFTYNPSNSSDFLRFRVRFDGKEEQFRWNEEAKNWSSIQSKPTVECERYNYCGNNSVCHDGKDAGTGKCSCLDGFEPKVWNQWINGDFSGGCRRRVPLKCQKKNDDSESKIIGGHREDGFKGIKCVKLPDFGSVISLDDSETCRDMCLRNCSCNAYANVSGIGCMVWMNDLVDIQRFVNGGSLLNIRMAGSELGTGKEISNLVIVILSVVAAFLAGLSIWMIWRFKKISMKGLSWRRKKKKEKDLPVSEKSKKRECSTEPSGSLCEVLQGGEADAPDLPIFSFSSVASATNNFSEENKLGHGGFGTVYKGNFPGGQEIAVKRLSGKSKQGLEEFKNEILLIARLQHRNLVRLLGCCIQDGEKILLYEYMPNKSLDGFLFDETRREKLDWKQRVVIVEGIARGLLYLHRDSRLRIIHRDLKASNILLDNELTPKISDFGMARIFSCHQDEANTIRVVGTYGYMSPEYAMGGLFSEKSDVYSFGVLIMEIVSGRRNVSLRQSEHGSLIGYAWHLWSQGRAKEMIDPTVRDSCDENEALRCIHVSLLCVQDNAAQRPNMAAVVLMLESQTQRLAVPRQPTFHSFRSSGEIEINLDGQDVASVNDVTLTSVLGR
ncbi:PREDICTED: putative G-type lectin S-receptor-like serine/threonine-protein kinase At1g61610 [Tarenaya hassleriana]|uniref:putative G-type lectin S-receptor-like serine/threonine-protein kinase At1g61610 n=1 Tax=Tarenaya hassleriana TaxID=28532 RepID=UPI00053C2485|nr:PREDICTED: putative G-type lectin S-receptor-like serine/threonine-protein kinase At1g61610 [Tarenaya hassleriana]